MRTLYGIQYLRAIAALGVVLFHAGERAGMHFSIGAAGVDIFFVISGFIMWVITDRRAVTPLRFLFDRIVRIAPSYWLVTGVMIAGAAIGLFPNLKLTAAHILGSLVFIPMRSPSNGEIWPVLVQGWTLNFEMFFYAVFACALFLPKVLRIPALAIAFTGFVLAGVVFDPQYPALFTYTRPIILEFLSGILLGQMWLSQKIPSPIIGLALVGAAACGFAAIYLLNADFDEFICGPLAFMLVAGVLSLEHAERMPRIPALTYLGNASYSIYLWHTLAISVVLKLAQHMSLSSFPIFVISIAAGTIAGLAAFEAIEKPLRFLLSKEGARSLTSLRRRTP